MYMKRMLLTLTFLLALIPALMAQDGRSIVRVRLSDNTPMNIAIDGRSYNENKKVITVDNIPAGRHRLQVFLPGKKGGRKTKVYDDYFKVDVGTYTYIIVDRYKGTTRINTGYRSNLDKDSDDRDDRTNHRDERDNRYDDRDRDGRNGGSKRGNGYNTGRVFSSEDMHELKVRVEDRMHSGDKVKLMKSVLADRNYTTDQVRTMLAWLSFDDSKLDFAKWAHTNVIDKKNYWKLEDAFSFSSTKDKFSDYIAVRR